ncbi:MAG: hypothetical protein ACI4KM_03930 [Oscillospiraceae bacterium]
MTGWIIFGAVVLLIVILLICPIAVYFEYAEDIILRVRYLFITIFRIPPKTKKLKRRDKKDVKTADKAAKAAEIIVESAEAPKAEAIIEKASAKPNEKKSPAKKKPDSNNKANKPKPTLSEIFAVVKMLTESLGKPLKKLLHRTRIINLRLDIICGGDDAAKAALNYGKTNIVAGNALGWLETFFTVVKPDINIGVDFESEDTLTEMSCKIKLSLGAALAFLLVGFFRILKNSKGNNEVLSALNKLRGK